MCLPQKSFLQTNYHHVVTLDLCPVSKWDSGVRFKPLTTFGSLGKIKNETNPRLIGSNFVKLHKVRLIEHLQCARFLLIPFEYVKKKKDQISNLPLSQSNVHLERILLEIKISQKKNSQGAWILI